MSSFFEIGGVIVESHKSPVSGSPEPPRIPIPQGSMHRSNPQGFSESKGPAAQGAAGGTPEVDEIEKWGRRSFGSALVRVGAIGLMVPDPIPFVDELIFAGMIGVGVALHATTW